MILISLILLLTVNYNAGSGDAQSENHMDGKYNESIERAIMQADAVLEMPLLERVQVGRRLSATSREAVRRMVLLGMVWHLTGDQVYADRMAEELWVISSFSD